VLHPAHVKVSLTRKGETRMERLLDSLRTEKFYKVGA